MIIELVIIGNEILDGRRIDTNTSWLGRKLSLEVGQFPRYRQTVLDQKDDIVAAYQYALSRSDIIISTGGLGPTADDLTFDSLAQAVERRLEYRPHIFEKIQERFAQRGLRCTESNKRQAQLPQGSIELVNDWGTAPGCRVDVESKVIFALPGVPLEMSNLFERDVVPEVQRRMGISEKRGERIFKFTGLPESYVEERLQQCDLYQISGADMRVAYTASFPQIEVTLSVKSTENRSTDEQLNEAGKRIESEFGDHLVALDQETLEGRVVEVLGKKGATLAIVESVTGGLVASRIVSVAGSSDVFDRGVVVYSNRSKKELLGVSSGILERDGAVSEECAVAMAEGALARFHVDVVVATTGIAGPEGESSTKPVGLTFIAWRAKDLKEVRRYQFTWDRNRNRMLAATEALRGLLRIALRLKT